MLVADPNLVTADMVEDVLKFKRLDGAICGAPHHRRREFQGRTRSAARCATGSAVCKMPVQVIWGEADRVLPAKHAEGLPPIVKVTRIAGAGHIPHMEKAAEVNAAIKALWIAGRNRIAAPISS